MAKISISAQQLDFSLKNLYDVLSNNTDLTVGRKTRLTALAPEEFKEIKVFKMKFADNRYFWLQLEITW